MSTELVTAPAPSPDRAAGAAPHALSAEGALMVFGGDPERGLSDDRAAGLRARHGPTELTQVPPAPPWRQFLAQLHEPVVYLLLAAALISALIGEWADALAILAIVLLNALLGFFQEERARRALASLRRLSAPTARAVRDGVLRTLPARELVPGDLIEL